MELDIIFLSKKGTMDIDSFKKSFKNIIIFGEKNLSVKNHEYNYTLQKMKGEEGIRVTISTIEKNNTIKLADNLSYCKNLIENGKHRKDYNIIFVYDEASEYYCSLLVKYISSFERKLRRFIYLIIVNALGNEWYIKSTTDELKAEIKKIYKKNKMIECALEYFTFHNYIQYLFDEKSNKEPKTVIKEVLLAIENKNITREEIVTTLRNGEGYSLWNKYFHGMNIDFSESEISAISEIRNKVMHNREISKSEYVEYNKIIRKSIKKLNQGISNTDKVKYSCIKNTEIIYEFLNIFKYINQKMQINKEYYDRLSYSLLNLSENTKNAISYDKLAKALLIFEKHIQKYYFDEIENICNTNK